MLRMVPFANALAAIAAAFYVLCAMVAAVAPDLYAQIAGTWVHGIDVTVLFPNGTTADIGSSVLGLITFTATAWVAGAILALIYNRQGSGQPGA